jgi:four helix bundle protein
MYKFGFQSLDIYDIAKSIVIRSYQLVKQFPDVEKFALVQQINRAVISIPSNIAEGYSRSSNKDKAHFLNIAYGSLMEIVCQYEISASLGYITDKQYEEILGMAHDLAVRISNFRTYLGSQKRV